ncbi:beta strand repeat-containing protein, partial [Pseudorhodoplanes sp.]|uniref:beta strand repeat-containing protein n=1 Tax=Pseudorhodoplanes sp. TaxID=1934341 RepID=UPI00391C0534
MTALKSSAAHVVPRRGRAPQLVLDPLEPRLMLNADVLALDLPSYDPGRQDHDLLVRLVEDIKTVDNQSVAVQRIEIVDRTDPSHVLAAADFDGISRIAILGGAGDDRITIDTDSFAGFDAPGIVFSGGAGVDTLSLVGSAASDWHLDGQGGGTVSGPLHVEFSGVERLEAGSGTDTLHGSVSDTDWQVDGEGAGRIGAHVFDGFENLVGAADNNDVFTFTQTGRLAGLIDGGAGGYDSLVLDTGIVQSLVAVAFAPDAGSLAYDSTSLIYKGLEPVTVTGTQADVTFNINTLAGGQGDNVIRLLYDTNAGMMLLDSVNGKFEDHWFNAPTNSLTIIGGSGTDDITILSLSPGFAASLTVNVLSDGYDPFNTGGILPGNNNLTTKSVIRVSGDLSLNGKALQLSANTILVGTVAEQTGSTGSWAANQTFTNVNGSGGSGSGMRAELTTDADGNVTARIIQAGTGYANGDQVTFSLSGGRSVTVKLVNAADSAIVSTQKAGGNAGDILFGFKKNNATYGGQEIYLGPNAQLLAEANAAAGYKPGKITLAATDIAFRAASWPLDFTHKSAFIEINGATIKGGAISITAKATDTNAASEESVPSFLRGFVGNLTNLLNQIPGALISAFTGIDVSVVMRGADAKIHLHDATIVSAASVDISASTKVDTQVYALAMGMAGLAANSGFEFAAGYGLAQSNVEVIISGTTSITADDNVRITASGDAATRTVARASSNLLTPTLDPNATSLAVAIAHTELNVLARVGAAATIVARNGNVNVNATGKTKQTADASTVGFVDGRAGVGVGLSFDFSSVVAELDGDIAAKGTPAGGEGPKFDGSSGSAVDLATNTIYVPDHGLTNGQLITYTALDGGAVTNPISGDPLVVTAGTAIGGLKDKGTYYVIVVDKDHVQLANAPVIDLDASGTDAAATHTIQVPAAKIFDIDAVDAAADTIRFADHGFETGDQVTYTASGTGTISGLTRGAVYTVEKIDDLLFQLKDGNGNVVQIAQGTALGIHSFTKGSTVVSLNLARVDAATDRISMHNHGFTADTLVNYASLADDGAGSIGGLVNEAEYLLRVVDANTVELYDVATGEKIDIGAATGGAAHALAYIASVKNINPTTAVDDNTDTITIDNHGLVDGQAIIYGTDPTKTRTQTVTQPDGQVLELEIADREIGGLMNGGVYYVVKVDDNRFRLVEDPLDVALVKAINLTSLGSGNYHALSDDGLTNGIGVKASLVSDTRTLVKPEVGGKFNPSKYKDVLSRGDIALASIFGNASASSGKQTVKDQNGKDVTSSIQNDSLSAAGAVGVNVVTHDVRAVVGERATSGDKTTLQTQGDIEVLASIEHKTQLMVQGSVSKPKGSQGAAVSVSIGVGVYDNDSQAIIRGNTQLDAFGTVRVDSKLTYPFLTKPEDLLFGIPQDIVNRGVSAITTLLDGTFGVSTKLMNNWVMAYAKATESPAASVSGSIAVNVFTNTSKALVQSGAEINQKPISATWQPPATQSVVVNAYTMMQLIEMVGIGKWSLNEGPLGKARYEGKTAAQLRKGGDIVDVAGRSGSKALGGSILVDSIDSTTHARIEGGAKVKTGASGSLTNSAKEDILRVAVSQSGGQTDDNGQFAFAGSGLGLRQRSDVQAGIVATDSAGPAIGGGGSLTITAETGGVQVGVAGSLVLGGSGSSGLGLSVMVADVERKVYAFVGADPSIDAHATPNGAVSLTVGAMTVKATTGGTIVGVIGTALALSSQGPVPDSPDDALDGASLPGLFGEASNVKSGIGIAGAAGVNVINDTTLASINARGSVTASTLAIEAENDQVLVSITGGVAISRTNGTQGGGGTVVGGAFSLNQLTADTRALIVNTLAASGANGLTVTATAADGNGDEILLSAKRGGTIVTFSAAISANMNTGTANAFSGSVSINRLVDVTQALVDGAAIVAADARMRARNEPVVVAIGGGASYTAGGKGIGASLGYNQLSAQTKAGIFGTARGASATLSDDLTIEAVNDQNLTAIGVSAGISSGGGGVGGAFTLGINIISTDEHIFTRDNAGEIRAGIENATVTTPGCVWLTAQDDSAIQAVAGALGIGTQGAGFGAGLGWNQIALKVRATIDGASVTAGNEGVNLSALSTDQNAVPAGKIAAAAVGGGGSGGTGVAVGVSTSVNGILNTIEASVTDNATVTVNGTGSLRLRAEDESTIRTFTGGVAISTGSGVGAGAAAGGNYVANTVTAKIDSSTVNVGGEVTVTADQKAVIQTMTLGLAGGTGGGNAGAGSLSVNVVTNHVTAAIDGISRVEAADDVRVLARNSANVVAIAGGVAGGSQVAVGIAATNVTVVNTTKAFIDGRSTVIANGSGADFQDILGKTRSGVSVEALSDGSIVIVAAGGAVSTSAGAGAGAITVTFVDDTVQSFIEAPGGNAPAAAGISSFDDVNIVARGKLSLVGVAGTIAGASSVGIGIGADAGVIKRKVEASIGNGAKVGAGDNVIVDASGDLDLASVSASGAFAGTGAGTLTAGVTVLDLTTRAFIGSNAIVTSDGNVVVQALDDTTIDQISANISGAGTGAVGVAAGVGVMNKTTEAYIDSGAQVTALAAAGKAGIAAYTGELVDALGFLGGAVSGSTITISAHGLMTGDEVFYNSPSPIQGLADSTRYFVIRVSDNEIRLASSLVNAALGNALTLGPGSTSMLDVHVLRKIDADKSGGSKDFASADVNYATNRITAAGHAFNTGEEIIYTAESIGIGGLVSGQRYYVIRYSDNSFGLAATRSAALSGTAVDLVDNGVAADARHLVQSLTGTGVPDIDNDEFDDSALAAQGDRKAAEVVQKGLIVAAVSLNDMTSAGVGVAISGTGSGALAGTVAVHTVDTRAYIAEAAKINQDNTGAGADQNVRVAAVRSYDGLAIGGGLAGSGTFAAAPAVAAPKLAGETMAYIQGRSSGAYDTVVNVAGDLAVQARAEANVISVAAGLAFSGTVSLAGSGAVVLIDTDTIASISGRVRVNAGGNVLVGASDDTTSHAIAGAVGIGLAGGGGAGAVNVTQIEKTTAAIIGVEAIVDANGLGAALIGGVPTGAFAGNGYGLHAIRGVAVVAQSSEKVVAVSASAGGGLYAGIAGAVSVELIDSDTFAAIGDGAAINMNTAGTAHPAQSVTVSARNTIEILAISGALGGGAAGIGGSFDVGLIHNDTQALIGAAQVRARDDVDVSALSRWTIDSNAIAVGAGLAGIGGGVVVYTIGGNFSDSYGGGGQSASALSGEDGDTVTAFVENTVSAMMSAMQTGDQGNSSDPALPVFNPASAVNTGTDTITLGADSGLNTGDSVVYSANGNSAIGGLEDGKVYFAIVDPSQPQRIKLAATYEDAFAGRAIDLTGGATGSNHRLSASSAQIGEIARQSSARNTPSVSGALSATGIRASGTAAAIESGAAIVAGDIDVVARQKLDFTTRGGGVGAGAGALGVGIVVLDIDVDTTSYIAPNVVLTGLYPANSSLSVTAYLASDIRALGFGGALSGFVSLGGAVAHVTDNSSVRALLGARPGSVTDDTQLSHAQSASSATQVTGFATVTVDADATIDHYVMNAAAAVSGIAGLGAAIVVSKIDGNVQAVVGDFTALGTTTGNAGDTTGFIGGLTVDANRAIGLHPFTAGAPFGIAIGGGILGAAAGVADITIGGEVTARLGNRASVYAAGDVDILATGTVDTGNIKVDGGAVGGIAVGIVIAQTTITPKTTASIGSRTTLQARSLDVKANSTATGRMLAEAAGGGVLSGQGLDVVMTVKPQTKAEIGSESLIGTVQALVVTSTANTTARVEAKAGNYGGVTVIIGKAKGVLENTNSVVIGDNAQMTAGTDLTALAASTNTGFVQADGGGGALVAITQAETDLEMKDTTKTLIGAGARMTASTNLSVESRTSSTGDSRAIALAQGLGANTKTDAAIRYSSVTQTEIGAGAQLRATGILDVIARVDKLDLDAYAESDADAAGADADADATIDPFAGQRSTDVGVIVRSGAKLLGDTQTNLKARQENLHSLAKADSDTDGLGGDTDATAINSFNAATSVLTEAGSEIGTRALYVEAEGGAHGASANAIRSGALIDGGSATQRTVVTFPRTIVFNSNVFLYGPANPELEIGASGNILKQVGIAPVITASEIVIPDIIYQSTAAGSATFSISQSSLDPNPAGYGTSPAENSIEGNATFTFVTGFDRITIINHSDRHLRIGSIDPYIQNPNFVGNLTVNVTEKSRFLPVTSSDPGTTRIEIVNTNVVSAPDIRLTKLINNRFGTTLIEAAGGDILTWAAAGAIRTTGLELIAGGVIGVNGAAIATESTLLRAQAGFGIVLVETGDLEIDWARSTIGLVDLTATGSILDGNATDAVNVAGSAIKLTANGGAIGLPGTMLRIDAARTAGALVANAHTGIAIIDDVGGLGIGTARSVTGDVTLQTRDSVLTGEDILLGADGLVQAVAGNVNIFSGDDLFLDAAAVIAAAGSVVLRGDHGNADAGIGTRMDLRGRITGTMVTIAGGDDADSIALRRVMFGAPVTIQSGGGQDAIRIGSQATTDTNSGGSLSTIEDTLIVDSGSEQDILDLDDSGSAQARSVVVKNGEITLSGVNGAIRFANTDTVALKLGDRNDSVSVRSTAADMLIDIDAGGGDDTFIFGGTDKTLNAIDGLVIARGGAGYNTMRVIDSGDTAANAGRLGGGNNNQIFGFGMGSADQTAIVETAGITYGDIQDLTIELGNGADVVAVEGISTKTTLKTGAGANQVTAGGALSRMAGDLLVQGSAGDSFVIVAEMQADLTLAQIADGRGRVTGIGMPGSITFEGLPNVTIRLSDDDDQLRIVGTAMPVFVDARGGNDTIVVETTAHATSFDLGDGGDLITVFQAGAAMTVTGDGTGGGTDRLIVDRTATTGALNARIGDGATVGEGTVSGMAAANIVFRDMDRVDVRAGSGNDAITIDVGNDILPSTVIAVYGGAGDDLILAESISLAPTIVDGGTENDTLKIVIPGLPDGQQFLSLQKTVETLIVDNSQNDLGPVAWILDGVVLKAATTDIVTTEGADVTRILGGQTGNDTLIVRSVTAANVTGVIDGDRIELRSGLVIVTQADPAQDFDNYRNYEGVIGFDGVTAGSGSYVENGFSLTTSNAAGFLRSDAISPSAAARAAGELFTLRSANTNRTPTGKDLTLYSIELANTGTTDQIVTISGVTVTGHAVSQDLLVRAGTGFQRYNLDLGFTVLDRVTFAPGTDILVDNIVARDVLINAGAGPVQIVPVYTLQPTGGDIVFNTATRTITGANILVDYNGVPGTDATIFAGTGFGSIANLGITAVTTNELTVFTFPGDLIIPDGVTVRVSGSNALSIQVGDDVFIGANVMINVSATGQNGVGGGGSGGAQTNGGAGGSGGSAPQGGGNGGGPTTVTRAPSGQGGAAGQGDANGGSGGSGLSGRGGAQGGGGGGGGAVDYSTFLGAIVSYSTWSGGPGGFGGTGNSGNWGNTGNRGATGHGNSYVGNQAVGGSAGSSGGGGSGGSGGGVGNASAGTPGDPGTIGGDAGDGAGGVNNTTGTGISGGMGGGSGGGGGGGGAGGGGGGGGGGRGAYWESGLNQYVQGGGGGGGGGGGNAKISSSYEHTSDAQSHSIAS